MYINHDDVVKLAAIDKTTKESHVKQPGFLGEVEREINVLYTTVRTTSNLLFRLSITIHFFFKLLPKHRSAMCLKRFKKTSKR